jgi:hypothetical protein
LYPPEEYLLLYPTAAPPAPLPEAPEYGLFTFEAEPSLFPLLLLIYGSAAFVGFF